MLSLSDIGKSYGATRAVDAVGFDAAPGTAMGLVGENGAGKSTLLKIIAGAVAPDRGRIALEGRAIAPKSTREALGFGIASVFQELTLVRDLTVEQNLYLTDAPRTAWRSIDRRKVRAATTEVLGRYALDVAPNARVGDLPLGAQQMLEIVRAVERQPRVLLLDEATSALGATEVAWLRELVGRLTGDGRIVFFISHRWDEVVDFCNRVAVLRNGELQAVADTAALSESEAVRLMSGREGGSEGFPVKRVLGGAPSAGAAPSTMLRTVPLPRAAHGGGDGVALAGENLTSRALRGVSLSVGRGEILGLGGLVGQGQGPLLEAFFGAHAVRGGTIRIGDAVVERLTPRRAMAAGVAYVPQERKTEGLLLSKSVGRNLTLAMLERLRVAIGLIAPQAEAALAGEAIARARIVTRGPREAVRNLSGGNQQKVLLEKWLLRKPKVLLLNDVTRGVDVGTKRHIYEVIAAIAAEGVGVVWYSTDARELVGVAHRVLVMMGGRVSAELSGADLTVDRIVHAAVVGTEARP